jgi:hypothetical protein
VNRRYDAAMTRAGALKAVALLLSLVGTSCGLSLEIPMGPLSGRIGGLPWTVATAQTNPSLSDAEELFAGFYAVGFAACSGTLPRGNSLLVGVPIEPGDYTIDSSEPATFFVVQGNRNLVAMHGRLKVDTVTPTAVTGGANIQFDGDDAVAGQFQLTRCP